MEKITSEQIQKAVRELKNRKMGYDFYWMRCLGPDGEVHYIEGKNAKELIERYEKLWDGEHEKEKTSETN